MKVQIQVTEFGRSFGYVNGKQVSTQKAFEMITAHDLKSVSVETTSYEIVITYQ